MNRKHPRFIPLFLLSLITLVLFVNCDHPVESITPDPEDPVWREDTNPKTLAARISNLDESKYEIDEVFVTWSRLPFDASNETNVHRLSASRESPGSSRWLATFSSPEELLDTQEISYNWHLKYHDRRSNSSQSTVSFVRKFQIGCSGDNNWEKVLLADQQTVVATYGGITRPDQIAAAGYVPTHGFRSFKGIGVAFVLPDVRVITSSHSPQLGRPDMLFFAPDPNQSAANLTEHMVPDPPYTLIGWAYAFEYNPQVHPRWQCIRFDGWFVHEAGWHPANGGFTPTPPAEESLGSRVANPPILRIDAIRGIWHPRLWDIHIWRNGDQVPALGIFSHTGEPVIGDSMPSGSFFELPFSPAFP